MTSAPAIGFDYRPSRLLPPVLAAIAVLAIAAILLAALPWWVKLVAMGGVVAATWRSVRKLAVTPVVAVGWSNDGGWTLHRTDHADVPAQLLSFRVLDAFVLLRLRSSDGVQALLLGPDNSDADIRRRLRMRLALIQPGEALPRL